MLVINLPPDTIKKNISDSPQTTRQYKDKTRGLYENSNKVFKTITGLHW